LGTLIRTRARFDIAADGDLLDESALLSERLSFLSRSSGIFRELLEKSWPKARPGLGGGLQRFPQKFGTHLAHVLLKGKSCSPAGKSYSICGN
jgi:hypothetical protein